MDPTQESLLRKTSKRTPIRANITKICKDMQRIINQPEREFSKLRSQLLGKLENLKRYQAQISTLNEEIEELVAVDCLQNEVEEVMKYDDLIGETIGMVENALKDNPADLVSLESSNSQRSVKTVKLPTLEFPKFDGTLTKWASWFERFQASINTNDSLSAIDKFNYLNSLLTGTASTCISGLAITAANYEEAIKRLEKRFGKKSAIVEAHLSSLIHLKPIRSCNLKDLGSFIDFVMNHISSLKSLDVKEETYENVLFTKIKESLTPNLQKEFRLRKKSSDLTGLLDFLQDELEALEIESCLSGHHLSAPPAPDKHSKNGGYNNKQGKTTSSIAALTTDVEARKPFCVFCQCSEHWTDNCSKDMDVTSRKEILKKKGRCFRCTRPKHSAKDCRMKIECGICKGRHHSLLHENKDGAALPQQVNVTLAQDSSRSTLLLQTALVKFVSNEESLLGRVLLDGGSQRTFILKETCNKLKLPTLGFEEVIVSVFGGQKKHEVCRRVKVVLKSLYDNVSIVLEALEIDKICATASTRPNKSVLDFFDKNQLQLADPPQSLVNNGIELLIGVDFYGCVLLKDTPIKLLDGQQLFAIATKFGWVVSGNCSANSHSVDGPVEVHSYHVSVLPQNDNPEPDILERFWNLEHLGISSPKTMGDYDRKLNDPVLKSGRFVVQLPWLEEGREHLGSNYSVARKRLFSLRKKLSKNPKVLKEYNTIIQEYLETGVIEKVGDLMDNVKGTCYYMPHRAILKDDRTTTKLRVVFDASSHECNQLSLNNCLWSGPDLLTDLLEILLRFRAERVVVVGDVTKAFLQISLDERDRDFVCFLWTTNDQDIVTYRFTRIPFGVTSSPALLNSTLQFLFSCNAEKFHETVATLSKSLYVDDLVSSVPSESQAMKLKEETTMILSQGSFIMCQWKTSSQDLRNQWSESKDCDSCKILGMLWSCEPDNLRVRLPPLLADNIPVTKRSILQQAAKIFDPMGLVAPFTIRVKILLQEVWKLCLAWDAPVPLGICRSWNAWVIDAKSISDISIPRCLVNDTSDWESVQLHTFVDASVHAYAAVCFLRFYTAQGVFVQWVACKTRVAPLKDLSLPRLELMGAVLGTRLANSVTAAFEDRINVHYFWTDSRIALGWIKGPPYKWKPFVSNRVSEIQGSTRTEQWHHCPGIFNPADLPSRGSSVPELKNWLLGPDWLRSEESAWPTDNNTEIVTVMEMAVSVTMPEIPHQCLIKYESFLLLDPLLRSVSCFLKAVRKFKDPLFSVSLVTSAIDINDAEKFCIRDVQSFMFPQELHCLKKNKEFPHSSQLSQFSCVLEDGIIRLKSRIYAPDYGNNVVIPIILSKESNFVYIIIRSVHLRLKHAGITETLAEIRSRFWIIKGRQLVKKIIGACIICTKSKAKLAKSATGALPSCRSEFSPPFNVTGVDFAGPLLACQQDSIITKTYICLFTCSVTRAIHLELVSDLSTDCFLLSFRRFIARRGIPQIIYSDNSKTFKRADRDLQKLASLHENSKVQALLSSYRIQWCYIVECAPWWGGHWERMVRSVKTSLKRTLGKSLLNFEGLSSILIEIEAVINSRPITDLSDSTMDNAPLTPSHFLIGQRLTTLPEVPSMFVSRDSSTGTLRKRWRNHEQLITSLACRWKNEYVLLLKSAHSHPQKQTTDLVEGQLVLLLKEKVPRHLWPMGHIHKLQAGRDGVARSAEIMLPNKTVLRRPVSLLVPLEA